MNTSESFLKVFNIPGAIIALVSYSLVALFFNKQIVGEKDTDFKNMLTDTIVPVSVLSWIGISIWIISTTGIFGHLF